MVDVGCRSSRTVLILVVSLYKYLMVKSNEEFTEQESKKFEIRFEEDYLSIIVSYRHSGLHNSCPEQIRTTIEWLTFLHTSI